VPPGGTDTGKEDPTALILLPRDGDSAPAEGSVKSTLKLKMRSPLTALGPVFTRVKTVLNLPPTATWEKTAVMGFDVLGGFEVWVVV